MLARVWRMVADGPLAGRPWAWVGTLVLGLLAVATLLTAWVAEPTEAPPALPFIAAIALGTWFGGALAGAAAVLVAVVILAYISGPIHLVFTVPDSPLARGAFLLAVVVLVWLMARLRTEAWHAEVARRTAEDASRRLGAALGVARRLSADTRTVTVMQQLLAEIQALLPGRDVTVLRWDPTREALEAVASTLPRLLEPEVRWAPLGDGLAGRAAQLRAPVWVQPDDVTTGAQQVLAGMALPLQHEGRLVGALSVTSAAAESVPPGEVELLELLASQAAAVLVGNERAELEGVLLAVRTMQHLLNNQLALTVGYAELLARSRELPEPLRPLAAEASQGAAEAAATLRKLEGLTEVRLQHTGGVAPVLAVDGAAGSEGSRRTS